MKVLAVVPAYNEVETIGEVLEGIKEYKGDYVDKIVVVDDASEDKTVKKARKHDVDVVEHAINRGPGCALQTGLDLGLMGDYGHLIQIDGDGQHSPEYIDDIVERAKETGCDMVIGSRYLNKSYEDYSFIRRSGIRFFTKLTNLISNAEITDITSGYRLYDLEMVKNLSKIRTRHWAVEQTLEIAKKGYDIEEVSVEMPERKEGESQFNLKTFIKYPFKMLKHIIKVLLYR